ncbi:partitioning defective 3 homolog, partial [Limulus polyphemus]|uniref:Partitioning defective 3 homolog n=1 Tax=Limulus polyphemus TaxID=6850 RepID=A0ABM1BZG1_LIMPO
IIAIYEEQQSSCPLYNNGDGISAGSVGTGSPDITNEDKVDDVQRKQNSRLNADAHQVSSGTATSPELSLTAHYTSAEDVKEAISTKNQNHSELSLRESEAVPINNSLTSNEDKFGFTRLGPRCSVRLSMLSNSKDSWRWEEAAEKQLLMTKNKERKEPLGRPITMTYSEEKSQENDAQILTLKNGPGPLGIHIVPDHDSCGRGNGLRVQGEEPGSKVDKDGRLQVSDRIVEINQQNLVHVDFPEAQEIFKNALQSPEIEFRLGKKSESFSECLSPSSERIKSTSSEERIDIQRKKLQEDEEKGPKSDIRISTPINTVSFGQKNVLLTSNTRKMGRKLNVQLTKGPDGLGFSITTRDNPALGFCPIYIKNILPKGAAVKDGRLKPGDRLLKVNQIEVTGLSQAEAAAVLRNVSPGGVVNLLVSRQDFDTLSNLPRKLPPEKASDGINIYPWQYKEVFTFDIPLNDTGSAGLGISVKGHTSVTPSGPVDLGIFIKSIIHGGAVSKDGRLMADDQLLSINGISLLDMTNTEALKTVRKTMTQNEGPNVYPGAISLTVARIIVSSSVDEVGNENDSSVSFNDLNDSVFSSGSDSRCGSAEGSFIHNSFAKTEDRVSVEPGKNFEDGMSLDPRTVCTLNSNSDFDENMNQRESKHLEKKNLVFNPPLLSSRNPMVDRLTGQGYYSQTKPRNTLHSESDLCASHENCNDHQLYQARCDLIKSNGHTGKNTVQVPTDNRVSTHNEEANQLLHSKNHPESPHNILSTLENEDKKDDKVESKATQNNTDNLISSPDEDSFNLSRDGIGRHSISEKRHAKLDARKTNTFKRSKRAREEQEHLKQHQRNDQDNLTRHLQIVDLQYKQSVLENTHYRDQFLDKSHADAKENGNIQKMPLEVKPLKKSSSLESIENVVPELKKDSSAAVKNIDGQERFSTACRSSEVALEMNNQSENGSLFSVESYGCSPLAAVLNRPPVSSDRTPDDVISPDYRLSKKKRLLKGLGSMF